MQRTSENDTDSTSTYSYFLCHRSFNVAALRDGFKMLGIEISEADSEKIALNLVKDPVSQQFSTNAVLTTLASLEPLRHNDTISMHLLRPKPKAQQDEVQQLFRTEKETDEEALPGILPTTLDSTPVEKAEKMDSSRVPSPTPPQADKQYQNKAPTGGRKGKFRLVLGKKRPEAPKRPAPFVPAGFKAAFKGSNRLTLLQPSYTKFNEPFSYRQK